MFYNLTFSSVILYNFYILLWNKTQFHKNLIGEIRIGASNYSVLHISTSNLPNYMCILYAEV